MITPDLSKKIKTCFYRPHDLCLQSKCWPMADHDHSCSAKSGCYLGDSITVALFLRLPYKRILLDVLCANVYPTSFTNQFSQPIIHSLNGQNEKRWRAFAYINGVYEVTSRLLNLDAKKTNHSKVEYR